MVDILFEVDEAEVVRACEMEYWNRFVDAVLFSSDEWNFLSYLFLFSFPRIDFFFFFFFCNRSSWKKDEIF